MGKATILSGGEDGRYQVRVEYAHALKDAQIEKLNEAIVLIEERIVVLTAELTDTQSLVDSSKANLNAAISSEDESDIKTATSIHLANMAKLGVVTNRLAFVRLEKTVAEKRITFLENEVRENRLQQSWCADLSENLSGDVGTIEFGLMDCEVVLKPGYVSADYNQAQDGSLVDIYGMSPAAAFVNYAKLPGVSKWYPRYRSGTISNIDPDLNTCDVSLDPLVAAKLSLNENPALSGIPVEYMSCNARAFEDGDSVIVSWAAGQSKVVGFVDNPKPCGILKWYAFCNTGDDEKYDVVLCDEFTAEKVGSVYKQDYWPEYIASAHFYACIYGDTFLGSFVPPGEPVDYVSSTFFKTHVTGGNRISIGNTIYSPKIARPPVITDTRSFYLTDPNDSVTASPIGLRITDRDDNLITDGTVDNSRILAWAAGNNHGLILRIYDGDGNQAVAFFNNSGSEIFRETRNSVRVLASENRFYTLDWVAEGTFLTEYGETGQFLGTTPIDSQFLLCAVSDLSIVGYSENEDPSYPLHILERSGLDKPWGEWRTSPNPILGISVQPTPWHMLEKRIAALPL